MALAMLSQTLCPAGEDGYDGRLRAGGPQPDNSAGWVEMTEHATESSLYAIYQTLQLATRGICMTTSNEVMRNLNAEKPRRAHGCRVYEGASVVDEICAGNRRAQDDSYM